MATLYEQDFALWAEETARALRTGDFEAVDWTHLAEEIQSMAGREASELKNRVVQILEHRIKLKHAQGPLLTRNRAGWRASILRQQQAIERQLEDSPSLKRLLEDSVVLSKCYRAAARTVAEEYEEYGMQPDAECPWTWRQVQGLDPL